MPWRVFLLPIALMGTPGLGRSQPESVFPGINETYLRDGMVVAEWVERLEGEGRDVFDHAEQIVARLDLSPGVDVADIGAGTGLFVPLLAEAVGADGHLYAVDIVPKFLDHIDTQVARRGLANVETVLGSERSAELPPHSIDVAFICNVYHHFEYPQETLASLHDALRPGGQIVLIDYRRIPGVSADWILQHMRAGQEVFEREITLSGFRKTDEITDLLRKNYFVIFTKQES